MRPESRIAEYHDLQGSPLLDTLVIMAKRLDSMTARLERAEARLERTEASAENFERRCFIHEACLDAHDLDRACWDNRQEEKP